MVHQKHNLIYLHEALYNIHFPENPDMLRKAQYRLKFEELFYIQLNILKLKFNRKAAFQGHLLPLSGIISTISTTIICPFP